MAGLVPAIAVVIAGLDPAIHLLRDESVHLMDARVFARA
jgi:hypothetical protein